MIVARTHNADDALGSLDPLWQKDGRHTCPQHQNSSGIGIVIDPFGSNEKVCAYHLYSGCILFGGDRAETLSPAIGGQEGSRCQVATSVAIPKGFFSDGNQWNYLSHNFHNPNSKYVNGVDVGGAEQSPIVIQLRNSKEIWIHINSGPRTPDGKQGTFHYDEHIADLTPEEYLTYGADILWSASDKGKITIYDNANGKIFEKVCPTLDAGPPNNVYYKQGFYRPPNNGHDGSYYFKDTICWNDNSPDSMLAYIGGNVVPIPPVDKYADVRAEMAFFKNSSPHIYNAFDLLLKKL